MSFNVRVYGILITPEHGILVSDLLFHGKEITKFCGGGLEFGEGTRECLKREFLEEMNLKIEVNEHFYTTDFFQRSTFNPEQQIISVYYRVTPLEEMQFEVKSKPFQFSAHQFEEFEKTGETESFRFIPLENFNEDSVTLPIDKIVAGIIKNKYHEKTLG